jgi:hypothetical protein
LALGVQQVVFCTSHCESMSQNSAAQVFRDKPLVSITYRMWSIKLSRGDGRNAIFLASAPNLLH